MTEQFSHPDVVSWAQARGSNAKDPRDAAHEGWHGTSLNVEVWSREQIHAAIMELRPGDRARQEVCARAAEWLVCERLGVDYNPEEWVLISAVEAMRSGISMPYEAWVTGIEGAREAKEVLAFVEEVLGSVTA